MHQAMPGLRIARYRAEIERAIAGVIEGASYILGPAVEAFEAEFAAYLGAGECVGVGNGTDAIALALGGLGIGRGDEVVTTALSASGTAQGIALTGARPVFADVDPVTGCLDPVAAERAITPRTRAIVPVHLYGHPADAAAFRAVADAHGLRLVEDCAHAHGARLGGRALGTFGDAAAFSFYPTKNLGCLGDGGAVVCGDPELAARVRELRRHGWRGGGAVSQYVAGNSCLDELQAAVLSVLLRHLDDGNRERRAAARAYRDGLKGTMLDMPPDHPDAVYHQFVVRHPRRDRLREVLQREHRVPTGVHYFPPLHRHPAFAQGPVPSLPHTDRLSREVLSLPIQGEVAVDHLHEVVAALVATCPA